LEWFYGLERAPNVKDFLRLGAANSREQVLVRESSGGIDVAVVFPEDQIPTGPMQASDDWTQLIEAVSHFLFIAERARTELPTTQLELELQAEVDKFVVLLPSTDRADPELAALHRRLYEEVRFLHSADSEEGERYRLANRLAARFVSRLVESGTFAEWRQRLRAFYRAGQAEKIALALAA
jgi:hypothetical protein